MTLLNLPKPLKAFSQDEIKSVLTTLDGKVNEAVERLHNAPWDVSTMFLGHSGGKDSVLVTYLAEQAFGRSTLPILHNTKPAGVMNEVHPLTREFLYGLPQIITYLPLDAAMPSELTTQIDGTRMAEWHRDDGRSVDLVKDGKSISRKDMGLYMENGLFGRNFIYPIYDWSDLEVWAAIYTYEIPYSPEYEQ